MRVRLRASASAAAVGFALFACMKDFDKFEETGLVPPANDAPDTSTASDASIDASDDASLDSGPCSVTPERCVTQRSACRRACDDARETCEGACAGGNPAQCRQRCRNDESDCNDACNDTCRTCAGSCPTSACR